MAQFTIPQPENTELAGPITELVGTLVAVRPLGLATVKTEYGQTEVIRLRLIDLESKTDAGVRLLFWSTAQRQITDAAQDAPWVVGTFTQKPQVGDPTRSVYLFETPDMADIDPQDISDTIDSVTSVSATEQGPF